MLEHEIARYRRHESYDEKKKKNTSIMHLKYSDRYEPAQDYMSN